MKETNIMRNIMLRASDIGYRLFRNNVGTAWRSLLGPKGEKRMSDGRLLITDPILVRFGLHKGSGDLIGWKPVTITQDMVGKEMAVFTSVEVKTKKGRLSKDQSHWNDQVNSSGGIGIVARNEDDIRGKAT